MKTRLLFGTVLLTALTWCNLVVAQQSTQCCIYEATGGTAVFQSCLQPANGFVCAQQAYNWSPSLPGVDPDADDRLGPTGLGIFQAGDGINCGNPTCPLLVILPVELTSFEASYLGGTEVALRWETASETNNAGFHVERQIGSSEFHEIGFVEGYGNTSDARSYSFNVADLDVGRHVFRLKQVDFDGAFEYSSLVEADVELPGAFLLEPAYPNPFNPSTTIRFGVAVETDVTVELYDAGGKLVKTLFEGVPDAGALNTVTVDGSGLTSGTYLVKLSSADFQTSQSIILLK
jgi:hypothetical protein